MTKPKKRTTTAPRSAPLAAMAIPEASMTAAVAAELRLRDLDDAVAIVATIAAVGLGYRKGPAKDPEFLDIELDIDQLVAEALVERFADGSPPAGIDRDMHRGTVRSMVDGSLAQLGLGDAGELVRSTLTSLALGSWRPGLDAHARRNAIPGFLVAWYRAGRD